MKSMDVSAQAPLNARRPDTLTGGKASARRQFLLPTVTSISIQMISVLTLIMLLLLMVSATSGDRGADGGGADGNLGQGGHGEFAVEAVGSGSQSNENAAGDASSAPQPVDARPAEATASAPPADNERPPLSAGPLAAATPENRKKFFVMPEFPAPAANVEPAGAGGGDGFSDLEDRLRRAGAQTGDVQISLAWNNGNDLDLHVQTPGNEKIFFNQRNSSCGGQLDVDMNASGPDSNSPVENVFWPAGGSPAGKFRVFVHHYANHGGRDPTRYQISIKVKGETKRYTGSVRHGDPLQLVREFDVN